MNNEMIIGAISMTFVSIGVFGLTCGNISDGLGFIKIGLLFALGSLLVRITNKLEKLVNK